MRQTGHANYAILSRKLNSFIDINEVEIQTR